MNSQVSVVITIDTEPDDAWGNHLNPSVANVRELVHLQEILDRYGAKATILATYRMLENDQAVTCDTTPYRVTQGPQVAVLTDACNECGNCVTFCPTSDRPWRDKPRLYLDRDDFEAETDNAFMFIRSDGARGVQARFGGALLQLIEDGDVLRFTSPVVELRMDAESLDILESAVRDHPAEDVLVNPEHLGAMIVLHRAFANSMPEFPLVEANPVWFMDSD